jgi:hypothetical protein
MKKQTNLFLRTFEGIILRCNLDNLNKKQRK